MKFPSPSERASPSASVNNSSPGTKLWQQSSWKTWALSMAKHHVLANFHLLCKTGGSKNVHEFSPKPEPLLHLWCPWSWVSDLIAFCFELRYFAQLSHTLTGHSITVLTAHAVPSCLTSSSPDKKSSFTFFTAAKGPGSAAGICFLHLSRWGKKKGKNLVSVTASYICCPFGQYAANGSLPVIPVTRSTSNVVVANEANKAFTLTRRMRKHTNYKLTQKYKIL